MPQIRRATDEDELAAALAAVQLVLAAEAQVPAAPSTRSAWRAAAMLEAQGYAAARGAEHRTAWPRAAPLARSRRWSKGIVGS